MFIEVTIDKQAFLNMKKVFIVSPRVFQDGSYFCVAYAIDIRYYREADASIPTGE